MPGGVGGQRREPLPTRLCRACSYTNGLKSRGSRDDRNPIAESKGVHREVESEGLAEKYRAVIEGATPKMNRSAKDGARSSPHYGGKGVLIHPSYQGVCGWHGTEDLSVTPGAIPNM